MRKMFFMLFMLTFLAGYGQKAPAKFGDIPKDELAMKVYAKDSAAAAVVLVDYGDATIKHDQNDNRFQVIFERLRRIKILAKEGLRWADFGISLYHDNSRGEQIVNLKAVTYNLENGKIVETKFKNESVISEKFNDNFDITKITWPNVKVGSVLEITYKVYSDFLFSFHPWEFQTTIPVVWSEYRARIPEFYNYQKYMQGYVPLDVNESTTASGSLSLVSRDQTETGGSSISQDNINFVENRFRWAAKDVPAFKEEPFLTTSKDYISKIKFELSYVKFPNSAQKNYMGSWEDINKSYYEEIIENIKGNNSLKNQVDAITTGMTADEDKLNAIYNFVKLNVLWDENDRKYPNASMRKVLDDKKGSSAEINLLLASMCEKAGIQVAPVLLSTRDNGFIRESSPVSSQFNYVVGAAKLADKVFLLDATDKLLPLGMLPERCLNGKGFMVTKEGYQWISLQPTVKTRSVFNTELTLTENGGLKVNAKIDRSGYNSVEARKNYLAKGESAYVKEFVGNSSWEIGKSEFINAKELQQPFKEIHEITMNEHLTTAGNTIYLNPFIFGREENNPYKQEKRNYPVDFGKPFDEICMIKINIPADYTVDELPKTKVIALPNNSGKYTFNVNQTANTINILSNLSIPKSIYTQDEYQALREFYNQIVAKQAEQIVLKKK